MITAAQRGVTLIEMLVAMTVFAAVSATTVGLLAIANGSEERVVSISQDIAAFERARSVIRADFIQVVDRPYREPFNAEVTPTFLGGARGTGVLADGGSEQLLVAFVRNGWSNPGAYQPRASLQRVLYIIKEGNLVRRTRPYVDAAPDTPSHDQILFEGTENVAVEFRAGGRWVEDWTGTQRGTLPTAVRFIFTHPDHGPLEQLFLVGGPDE